MQEVLKGADIFVGVSRSDLLRRPDIEKMNQDPIVFALANPNPEILPEEAEGIASVIATGAATIPIRSTTCWLSPESSAGRWTPERMRSTNP